MKQLCLFLLITIAGVSVAHSQSEVPTFGEVETARTTPEWGVSLNGDTGPLALLSESKTNTLSGGVSISAEYDDDALSGSTKPVGNAGMLFCPTISVQQSRSRSVVSFNYSPGLTVSNRLSPKYDVYHDSNVALQFRVTEHMTFRVHDNFWYGTSSFDQFARDGSSVSVDNILHQPNTAAVTPLIDRVNNLGGADVTYRVAENTTIGVSGNFSNLHFMHNRNATPLLDAHTQSADAVYQRAVSEHQSIGLTYSYQNLTTLGIATEKTTSQSALVFDSFSFTKNLTFAVFAGPDEVRSGISGTYVAHWYADGGLSFSWQGQRSSARVGFIHHVTDGGGLSGAVSTYSLVSGARRKLGADWTANVEVLYGHNTPVESVVGPGFYSVIGNIGLQRDFGQHFAMAVAYGREYQRLPTHSGVGNPEDNREWVSINYRFQRALGH